MDFTLTWQADPGVSRALRQTPRTTVPSVSVPGVAVSGSPDDFDAFFLLHYTHLVRWLTLFTGDAERATDAAQEAFIKAYASWRSVRQCDSPIAWVRRVAINKCRDSSRADRRRRRRELAQDAHEAPPADAAVADMYLFGLLQQLTPRQRLVTVLYYVEDLSVADVAQTIGISDGAVKFHLSQARERLRLALDVDRAAHDV